MIHELIQAYIHGNNHGNEPDNKVIALSIAFAHLLYGMSIDTWTKVIGTAVLVVVNIPNIFKTIKFLRNGGKHE